MVKPQEELARSLSVLPERQGEGRRIFRSAEFLREDRERLLRSGYLLPVTRGWLMLSNPGSAGQCHRFGERWHLSQELSLLQARGEHKRAAASPRALYRCGQQPDRAAVGDIAVRPRRSRRTKLPRRIGRLEARDIPWPRPEEASDA